METIQLTPEVINAYKTLITNPKEHGLEFKPLTECFEKSDLVTPKHILAKEYLDYIQKPLPKVILYIIMDEVFGICDGKAESGDLGYHLIFKVN